MRRRSVAGLSLADAEARLWGKLPWVLFACSLPRTDSCVLATNGVGIALALAALLQFLYYTPVSAGLPWKRVGFQVFLLSSVTAAVLFERDLLQGTREVWSCIPVVTMMSSTLLGSGAQFLENMRRRSAEALAPSRYAALLASYLVWCSYGIAKGVEEGWGGAWPVALAAAIGAGASGAILMQCVAFGQKDARRVWAQPAHRTTARTPASCAKALA